MAYGMAFLCAFLSKGKGRRNKTKKTTCLPAYLFLRFFEVIRSDFRKCFYGVFGLPMQRNGQKNAIRKNRWEKTAGKKFLFSQLFQPKASDMGRNPDLVPDPNRLGGHLLVGHHCEA
jgi:hypothetical protein